MLIIKTPVEPESEGLQIVSFENHTEWHIGESLPGIPQGSTFEATWDELNLITRAMEVSAGNNEWISYGKFQGFQSKLNERLQKAALAVYAAARSGQWDSIPLWAELRDALGIEDSTLPLAVPPPPPQIPEPDFGKGVTLADIERANAIADTHPPKPKATTKYRTQSGQIVEVQRIKELRWDNGTSTQSIVLEDGHEEPRPITHGTQVNVGDYLVKMPPVTTASLPKINTRGNVEHIHDVIEAGSSGVVTPKVLRLLYTPVEE